MKTFFTTTVNFLALGTLAVSASACSVVNLSDLGIPNPFASGEDVPPAADPSKDPSTYIGPSGTSAQVAATTPGFDTFGGATGFDTNFNTGTANSFGTTTNVAPGSDPRPADPNAARAYDMIVARAQANCAVAPLIIGFGRGNGGYNANATCPASGGGGALANPYNTVGFSQ